MKYKTAGRLLVLMAALCAGCSHMSYTRAWETDTLTANGHSNTFAQGYDLEHQTNEIALLDRTGIVCGSLTTTMDAAGSAAEARRKAEEEGKRSYTYEYRQHSPAEYSGLDCGGYVRWGRGKGGKLRLDPDAENLDAEYPLDSKTSEAGLHVGYTRHFFGLPWLRYGLLFRLGMGSYGFIHDYPNTGFPETLLDNDDDKLFFRFPIEFSLKFFPKWLFGFGVEGFGGIDPLMLAFGEKFPEFYKHFDYGARAGYALTFDAFAVGLFGGYRHRNISWGDYVSQADALSITLSIDLNYDEF